jgi:hypothetical protein
MLIRCMVTHWHKDDNFKGSYWFRRKCQDQKKCSEVLRRPLGPNVIIDRNFLEFLFNFLILKHIIHDKYDNK